MTILLDGRVDMKLGGGGGDRYWNQFLLKNTADMFFGQVVMRVTGGSFAMVANTLYAVPAYFARAFLVDAIAMEVTTLAAGASARLGVYRDNGSIYPGSLLLDAGTVSVATTGVKSISISLSLPADELLWLAIVSDGIPTIRASSSGVQRDILGLASSDLTTNYTAYSVAFTFAALPDPFSSGASKASISSPNIGLSF